MIEGQQLNFETTKFAASIIRQGDKCDAFPRCRLAKLCDDIISGNPRFSELPDMCNNNGLEKIVDELDTRIPYLGDIVFEAGCTNSKGELCGGVLAIDTQSDEIRLVGFSAD